ncbi:MAG: hypothetical protein ACOY71_10150 [Gemmatimonadota bacterium]
MRSAVSGVALLALGLVAGGCGTLDISNPNAPDRDRALATGADVINLVGGAFINWYYSMQNYAPATAASTMALNTSMSWGNWGSRRYSSVPRVGFVNSSTDQADIIEIVNNPWYNNYAALVSANLALVQLPNLKDLSDQDKAMITAAAKFLQGATLANIAMFFNQGFIVDEATDVTSVTFSAYPAVRDAALAKLDAAIAAAGTASFQLRSSFLNIAGWTNTQLAQVANTTAARLLAYSARNRAETGTVNWARVVSYASRGISSGTPFNPSLGGDGVNFFDPWKAVEGAWDSWHRANQRVVKFMDPSQPYPYPASGNNPPVVNSPDQRVDASTVQSDASLLGTPTKDYLWADYVPFNPARGTYHFSNLVHNRYSFHSFEDPSGGGFGTVPFLLAAENDLLWAEGLIRSGGSRAQAAALINKTRVGRGGLPPLTGNETSAAGIPGLAWLSGPDNNDVLLRALFYERDVELMGSSAVTPLYDARRTDRFDNPVVQGALNAGILAAGDLVGTPRQFPVPSRELETLRLQLYTFAGKDSVAAANAINSGASLGQLPYLVVGGKAVKAPGEVKTIADGYIAKARASLHSLRRF